MSSKDMSVTFLVVGGGIAGVTCVETLATYCTNETILLLTESSVIKTVANLAPVARYLHRFDVHETTAAEHLTGNITTLVDTLARIEVKKRQIHTQGNLCIKYKYMCLCTGARPRLIDSHNSRVIGIRDTDSVVQLQRRLQAASSIVVVGNGGIASELVHELQDIEVHWVIKDNHVASTFVDPGAAYFFLQKPQKESKEASIKRWRYDEQAEGGSVAGAALGPDWQKHLTLQGKLRHNTATQHIHYRTQVTEIKQPADEEQPLLVTLANGEQVSCDFVVSATGVQPSHEYACDESFDIAADGGLAVNDMMSTNLEHIYAAGDVCTAQWPPAEHWFQMRLWTQARQMGSMAARSMAAAHEGQQIYQDFCFELFGHVTQLFGYSVVLLGRYNGQGLGHNYEILLRTTPGHEYIKYVLQEGRLRGAILIGNTELAETTENLILNGIDLTPFGDDILNPDIDIEDFFD